MLRCFFKITPINSKKMPIALQVKYGTMVLYKAAFGARKRMFYENGLGKGQANGV